MLTLRRLSPLRAGLTPGRAAMVVGLLLAGPVAAQDAATDPLVRVEFNKLEQREAACRSYMVLSNGSDAALEELSLDLVVFDIDDVIDRRLAVELGPVEAGRTRVEVFDMADLDCGRVARVLLNDVLTCSPERLDDATTCDAALRLSGRAVDFIR